MNGWTPWPQRSQAVTGTAGRRGFAVELAVVTALAVAGVIAGAAIVERFRSSGGVQDFYQTEFGPAVLLACGHGYRNPSLEALPELLAFLQLESDRFDCASLPSPVPASATLDPFHRTSRYLESAIVGMWRLVGISWSGLVWFGGVLYAAVICLVYALCRVQLTRLWALLATVAVALSPLNLSLLPHYRDYAKGPFILAMMLLMARLTIRVERVAAVLVLAAAGGVTAGLGLGFRNDLLLTLLPFALTLAAFTPTTLPRLWLTRAVALVIFVVSFAVIARPVLVDYSQGSNTGHVILLGLTKPFDDRLGIEGSVYDFGFGYSDSFVNATIDSYARRSGGWPGGVRFGTAEYDQAAVGYLKALAVHFPADFLTRTLAAVRKALVLPLQDHVSAPRWLRSRGLDRVLQLRAMGPSRLAPLVPLAVSAVIIGISARSLRIAAFLTVTLLLLVGGAAIQFNERHFFHLEFIPWLAAALIAQSIWQGWRRRERQPVPRKGQALAYATGLVLVVGAAVIGSRLYQDLRAKSLFAAYVSAATTPVPLALEPLGGGRVRAAWTHREGHDSDDTLQTSLAVADFESGRCAADGIAVTLRYAPEPANDFSHDVYVKLDRSAPEPARIVFPVYDRGDAVRFFGIELPETAATCLTALRSVAEPSQLPVLLDVSLGHHWDRQRLHQTVRF